MPLDPWHRLRLLRDLVLGAPPTVEEARPASIVIPDDVRRTTELGRRAFAQYPE